MSRIFKELPIVFPFYELKGNQDQYRENVEGLNQYNLISPNNALLPFQIEMPANKPNPIKWIIVCLNGSEIDITNNLNKIKVYEFGIKKQAVYFGEKLSFVYGQIDTDLNLPCGNYYTEFIFGDGSKYVSEIFTIPENAFQVGAPCDFVKVDFWNEKDIAPVLYRDNFVQTIYLNTFVHSFVPEIEEEQEKDGFNNEIPVFQKMLLRYKMVEVVPDFVKIALISLQMHDHVIITINGSRTGEIDRVQVTAQPHEGGGLNDVDIVFEDDILYKTNCGTNEQVNNVTHW